MLIKIPELQTKFEIVIKSVLHLGAHMAEEALDYQLAGATKVIWIEGNPELMPVLETELKKFKNQFAYNVLISDVDNKAINFNVTNNFQSSSILDLGSHKEHHPEIEVHHTLQLKSNRLDTYFNKNKIDITDCNFLNIDLQGAELLALKGLGEHLENIDYIYTEVNTGSVYKGCATLFQLDNFLHKKGFCRVDTRLTKWEWGDAFYIKNNPNLISKLKNNIGALYHQSVSPVAIASRNIYIKSRGVLGKIKRKLQSVSPNLVDVNNNGESEFIQQLIKASKNKIVIFDVGANVGEYTKMVLSELDLQQKTNFEIHLFEPQKKCFEFLNREFETNPAIRINNFALSDIEGEATINSDYAGSSSASLFERKAITLSQKEIIGLRTLKNYLSTSEISQIDLLKIDTEGNEKKVLVGADNFLQPNFIKAIQFEYGGTYLDAGITLAEVVQLLLNKNYNVGKLTQNKIEYKSHPGSFVEDYLYSNYVATERKLTY